jgi:hypothetical protein
MLLVVHLEKLDDVDVKEKYRVEISNRFGGFRNFDDSLTVIVLGKVLEQISSPQPKKTRISQAKA